MDPQEELDEAAERLRAKAETNEPIDPLRDKFDYELADGIAKRNQTIIQLRLELARADEAKRIFIALFVFLVMLIFWRGLLHDLA